MTKASRRIDKALLESYRAKGCAVCGLFPSDPDHIQTKGAGGPDEDWNLWPLCRFHHTQRHQIGIITFIEKYPILKLQLKIKGWLLAGKDLFPPEK